jgi:hypothetical protein
LLKTFETNKIEDLEQSVNSFLGTVLPGNLIEIQYEPLQAAFEATYTAMVIYKAFPEQNGE